MYCVLDIESSGGAYRQEQIIEIAAYRYDGHKIIDQFISLIQPGTDIHPYVQKLTGITSNMVRSAPKFHEVARRVVEITEGCTLVGHNIEFDYRMLRQSFRALGYDYHRNTIDTIALAKEIFPKEVSYSLGKLCKSLGIPLVAAHRAADDARATLELFRMLAFQDKDYRIIQSHKEKSKIRNQVLRLRELGSGLPSQRGILYFKDKNGKILHQEYTLDIQRTARNILSSPSEAYVSLQKQTTETCFDLLPSELFARLTLWTKGQELMGNFRSQLMYKGDNYFLGRISKHPNVLLRFTSSTQGKKALNFIKKHPKFHSPENLIFFFNETLEGNCILSGKGRSLDEHSFIMLEEGCPTGFGYYQYHTQITSLEKVRKLSIPLPDKLFPQSIWEALKIAVLTGEYTRKSF